MEETIKALRDPSKTVEMPQAQRELIALIAESRMSNKKSVY